SLEALKEKKKDELLKQKEQEIENNKRETLLNKVTENVEVDIPKAMVDTELDQMLKEFEQRLQMQGMTLDNYFQFSGQSEKELKKWQACTTWKPNKLKECLVETQIC